MCFEIPAPSAGLACDAPHRSAAATACLACSCSSAARASYSRTAMQRCARRTPPLAFPRAYLRLCVCLRACVCVCVCLRACVPRGAEVLTGATIPNVAVNAPRAASSGAASFVAGEWSAVAALLAAPRGGPGGAAAPDAGGDGGGGGGGHAGDDAATFDLVLSADTLYSVGAYAALVDLLRSVLSRRRHGIALLAAKRCGACARGVHFPMPHPVDTYVPPCACADIHFPYGPPFGHMHFPYAPPIGHMHVSYGPPIGHAHFPYAPPIGHMHIHVQVLLRRGGRHSGVRGGCGGRGFRRRARRGLR